MNTPRLQTTPRLLPDTHETVAAVAHDLKLPLSHIKGFVSSLRRDDLIWDEDTRQEFLAEIEQEVDRLTQMVEGLMCAHAPSAHARRARGGPDAERAPIDPTAIVNPALRRTQVLLGDRALHIDIAPGLPWVRVNACQIERVLVNLLQNAVKYSSPSTPISVSARTHGSDELELSVENEGPGISIEDQKRVFEPFFRNKTAAQSGVPGHGLGLAICQSIALAHGGRMGVASRPGRTRFSVFLPVNWKAQRERIHVMERKAA